MKILMVGWEFPPHITGGLGTACEGLLQGFAHCRRQLDITFVLPSMSGQELAGPWTLIDASRERRARDTAEDGLPHPGNTKPGPYCLLAGDVAQFADDAAQLMTRLHNGFDVIHAHDWLTFPAALAIKAATGKPLVAHVHSTVFDRNESPDGHILGIERAGLVAADQIIAVSHYTKKILVERFLLPPSKIRVVHNGWIATAKPADVVPAARLPLVSFLGRITYQKGPHVFLRAARKVLDTVPDARFVMAGEGDLLASCKSLAIALGIDRHIEFPGFLDRSACTELLARSAAFVMPSVSEPFGIVALEAAAAGTPMVLSNRSGVAEVVSAALLVEPSDHLAIADAVCQLLLEPSRAARLASQARLEAVGMRWEIAAQQVAGVYDDMMHSQACFDEAASPSTMDASLDVAALE